MTVLLFVTALLGGALNAIGGGATFFVFPVLVFAGVAPLTANVTSSVALFPASIATSVAYRGGLDAPKRAIAYLAAASAMGTLGGVLLLLHTPVRAFDRLVPWLLFAASLVFTFGAKVASKLAARHGVTLRPEGRALWVATLAQVGIGVYGGYFGAGMGILMTAELSLLGLRDMHSINALRSVLTMLINAVAVTLYVIAATVAWRPAVIMILGGVLGGYAGAAVARRADPRHVRRFVVFIAWGMTAYFFIRR